MSTLTSGLRITLLDRDLQLSPDEVPHVDQLRSQFSCVWTDAEAIEKFNPVLQIKGIESKHQPLRLVWTDLMRIDFKKNVYSDEFIRNTIVITTDQDIASHGEIAFKLEQKGIGILTQGQNKTELQSVLKTLVSLKLNSLLIEGSQDSKKIFESLGLIDVILSGEIVPATVP